MSGTNPKLVGSDQDLVADALRGNRGEDQKAIAEEGVSLVATLLRKNADYGGSAWKVPIFAPQVDPGTAMMCRMSDKVERVAQLVKRPAEVAESLEDSAQDLAGYLLLWRVFKRRIASAVSSL